MTLSLGIDLGSTVSRAALHERGTVRVLSLEADGGASRTDGVGPGLPPRLADAVLRLGDPTPMQLEGLDVRPVDVVATLLASVRDAALTGRTTGPVRTALVAPQAWGRHRLELLGEAAVAAGMPNAQVVGSAVAVATRYGRRAGLGPGSLVGVADLGGRTFGCAVLQRVGPGFVVVGRADGVDRLGGADFDLGLLRLVDTRLLGALGDRGRPGGRLLDRPDVRAAVRSARQELSALPSAAVRLDPGYGLPSLVLTRGDLEDVARPLLRPAVDAVVRSLRSAQIEAAELSALVLVGGTSVTPVVADTFVAALGCTVSVPPCPEDETVVAATELVAAARPAGPATVELLTA